MPKRRTKGDGGITQRHDHESCPPVVDGARPEHKCRGRYQGTLDVEIDGRKRRKYVYGRTKKEAAFKLATLKRDRDRGALVATTVTVEAWMGTWLERQATKLKPQTMRTYREKSRNYIVPQLGRHKLTKLRAEHIEGMYDQLRRDGKAEATIRQTHAILKKALSDAVKRDKLGISPMDKVDPPGTFKNKRDQWSASIARHVLATAADNPRWWLALFYGMRQGEVLGLQWQHIDLDARTLKVEQTLQAYENGELFLGTPKTKASQRTLPLHPLVEARLRVHWETEGRPETGLVFHNDGRPIQPKRDWNQWRELIDEASRLYGQPIPYIALHAARNSAASLMETAGIPDRLVMQILGQSQVTTTHGYQAADVERIRQAFTTIGEILELE